MKKFILFKILFLTLIMVNFFPPVTEISAEILLNKNEALKYIFPKATDHILESKKLTKAQKNQIKTTYNCKIIGSTVKVYLNKKKSKLLGRTLFVREKGKHGAIMIVVGINLNGSIKNVAVCSYKEVRGKPVKSKMFLRQFKRKTLKNSFTVGKDVQGVTGATISSKAVTLGIKKALALIKTIYG